MAFREIAETIDYPEGVTPRYKRLDALDRMLDGTLFDGLLHPFSTEKIGDQYVKIAERRPDLPFNAARIVVDQTNGLLFGGEQMPLIKCGKINDKSSASKAQNDNVEEIVATCELDAVMMEVYEVGSSGSVALVVRSNKYREPYFDVVHGKYGKPVWDPLAPNHLMAFIQTEPIKAKALIEAGVDLGDDVRPEDDYWTRLLITDKTETRYQPLKAHEYARLGEERADGSVIKWILSEEYPHRFGVVPVIWGKNLIYGKGDDGRATFEFIKDIQVRIAQLLSQCARGYTYSADPMLARKRGEMDADARMINPLADEDSWEIHGPNGETVRSSANVLDLGRDGDAKLLEITGNGLKAAVDFIKMLREWALELVGAMKSDAEHTKGVASGRALEMLYQSMQLLLKRQRIAYGNRFFIPLIRMLMRGVKSGAIVIVGVKKTSPDIRMALKWPQWMTPRAGDLAQSATAWETLAGGSQKSPVIVLPPRIVTEIAANELGLSDPSSIADEVDLLREEQKLAEEQALNAAATAAQSTDVGDG